MTSKSYSFNEDQKASLIESERLCSYQAGAQRLFSTVLSGVGFASVGCVLGGMLFMPGGSMSVVSRFFVVTGLVVLSGFGMVLGSFAVMLGSLLVVFSSFFGHGWE